MDDNHVLSANGVDEKVKEATPEGTPEARPLPPPTFGFDEAGTFFLQIHSKAGFLAMIGFLQKAVFWMNDRHEEYEKKTREHKNGLIKPSGKGFGKFNLFK